MPWKTASIVDTQLDLAARAIKRSRHAKFDCEMMMIILRPPEGFVKAAAGTVPRIYLTRPAGPIKTSKIRPA
jgi:hypothetical protein